MLAATIRIVQILDQFEVRCVISEFHPGLDPEQFSSTALRVTLPEEEMAEDSLTIVKTLLGLWSEMTNH